MFDDSHRSEGILRGNMKATGHDRRTAPTKSHPTRSQKVCLLTVVARDLFAVISTSAGV